MKMSQFFSTAGLMIALAAPVFLNAQEYVHKDSAKCLIKPQSELPDGWMVFAISGQKGIWKSPIKNYAPVVIPGTEQQSPTSMDISDDGKWIVYCDALGYKRDIPFIIGIDGKNRVALPQIQDVNQNADPSRDSTGTKMVRWYRGSPKGTEVMYEFFQCDIRAIGVTLKDNTVPVIGTKRDLVAFPRPQPLKAATYSLCFTGGGDGRYGIWKDQIWGKVSAPVAGRTIERPVFITIPDGGNGTATGPADFGKFTNDTYCSLDPYGGNYWGCGFAMSNDGALCIANSGWIGSTIVANKKTKIGGNEMDHKGFYITKFLKSTDPSIPIDDQVDNPTWCKSTNWVPSIYRFGGYSTVDFTNWAFANNSDYVIGTQGGSSSSGKGIWIINWQTNTWHLVSAATAPPIYIDPALWISSGSSVKPFGQSSSLNRSAIAGSKVLPSGASTVTMQSGITGFSVYSLSGKVLWQYRRASAGGSEAVQLPQGVASGTVKMVRFEKAGN